MNRITTFFWLLAAAAIGGLALGPRFAPAQGPKKTDDKQGNVKVTMVVILASKKHEKVDPRLKRIAVEVRKRCKKLKGFRLALIVCKSLPLKKKIAFALVEKQQAYVSIHHGANRRNRVKLSVKPPHMGKITYRSSCGKFLPIVTPYHTATGERLILAIRVQPCHGG